MPKKYALTEDDLMFLTNAYYSAAGYLEGQVERGRDVVNAEARVAALKERGAYWDAEHTKRLPGGVNPWDELIEKSSPKSKKC